MKCQQATSRKLPLKTSRTSRTVEQTTASSCQQGLRLKSVNSSRSPSRPRRRMRSLVKRRPLSRTRSTSCVESLRTTRHTSFQWVIALSTLSQRRESDSCFRRSSVPKCTMPSTTAKERTSSQARISQ